MIPPRFHQQRDWAMKEIVVIGAGKIGSTIAGMLK